LLDSIKGQREGEISGTFHDDLDSGHGWLFKRSHDCSECVQGVGNEDQKSHMYVCLVMGGDTRH